jgi:hypothetical protein
LRRVAAQVSTGCNRFLRLIFTEPAGPSTQGDLVCQRSPLRRDPTRARWGGGTVRGRQWHRTTAGHTTGRASVNGTEASIARSRNSASSSGRRRLQAGRRSRLLLRTTASNGMTRRPTAVLRMDTRSSASTASTISSLRRRRAPRQSVRTSRTGRSSGLLPHPLRPLRPHPFTPRGKARTGARERWNSNVTRWKKDLPGLADVDIRYVGGGELLERLTRPGNEGRQWFFFRTAGAGQRLVQGTGHAC